MFSDSETFTRKRPTITVAQKEQFYEEFAQEIIDNMYQLYGKKYIIAVLASVFNPDTDPYQLARECKEKELKVNIDFVSTIEKYISKYNDIIYSNVKTWIKAHNIKPKFKEGDKVKIKKELFPFFQTDKEVTIDEVMFTYAQYIVNGITINCEALDQNVELV